MFQGLPSLGSWVGCRLQRSRCWLCHWYCWWRWCARDSPAAPSLRRYDPYPHFRWGLGSVRSHRCHLPLLQKLRNFMCPGLLYFKKEKNTQPWISSCFWFLFLVLGPSLVISWEIWRAVPKCVPNWAKPTIHKSIHISLSLFSEQKKDRVPEVFSSRIFFLTKAEYCSTIIFIFLKYLKNNRWF